MITFVDVKQKPKIRFTSHGSSNGEGFGFVKPSKMKTIVKVTFMLLTLVCSQYSIAENPRVSFAYNLFSSPGDGPYIETYLQFDASSLKFVETENNKYQAAIEILLVFKQEEQIIEFRKYELKSPAVEDTTQIQFSFIDQQRFLLPNGDYQIDISLADKNKEKPPLNHTQNISVNINPEEITISSIQLAERIEQTEASGPLSKSGFDIYPYVDYFYPENMNAILFYTEVYNASKLLGYNEGFLIVSSIETFETRQVLPDFNRFKRESARPVNVLINSFDISKLPSGNYFLVVSVKNKNNETLASNRVFFQRSNPEPKYNLDDFHLVSIDNSFAQQIVKLDSLSYFIKALGPISSYSESAFAYNLARTKDLETMQQYFYNFWLHRDPANPELAWKNYYIEMCRADANFKTRIKRGYETDRGRVYLQYGPPNSISKSYDEPSVFPYEIWHYYTINGQRDKRFVFFSRDLSTNDFELIHSDVIGELANPRWHLILHARKQNYWDVDTEFLPDHWGSRSRDLFIDPR